MMKINTETCIGCGLCVKDCFPMDIVMENGKARINNVTCMNCGHCIAVCPVNAVSTDSYNMDEILNYTPETFSLNEDHLLNFIKFRRSVRHYQAKDVETEKLLKIIEAGRFTQTGGNVQDVSFTIVQQGLQELKVMTINTLKQMGDYLLANMTAETLPFKRYAEIWVKMYEAFQANPEENDMLFFNAPAIIVLTAKSDVNGALAASNMELMMNAMGLGTCYSGFFARAAQTDDQIKAFLDVEEGKHVVACMIVGYPDVKYLRTVPRKEAVVVWK